MNLNELLMLFLYADELKQALKLKLKHSIIM